MTEEIYRTKVSVLWYGLTGLMVALIAIIFYYLPIFLEEGEMISFIFLVIISTALLALIAYTFFKIKYKFNEHSISVIGIFTNLEIQYSSVTEVKEISSFLMFWFASYTFMSMDQLEIKFKDPYAGSAERSVIISPKKKEEFIAELEAKVPRVKVIRKKRKGYL